MLTVPVPRRICFCRSRDPGDEGDAGGDVLGAIGDVFADIGLGEAEFIGEQKGFAVLLQRLPPILGQGMDRHGEEAEFHGAAALGRSSQPSS